MEDRMQGEQHQISYEGDSDYDSEEEEAVDPDDTAVNDGLMQPSWDHFKAAPPHRCAVVLRHGNSVLVVKHRLQQGGSAVTLPGGKPEEADTGLHAAAA